MARLSHEHKRLIVQRLATFVTPSEIKAELQELGVTVSLSQIAYYAAGKDLAPEWRDLYVSTRRTFIEQTSEIAGAHRSWRLRELVKLYRRTTAGSRPNIPLGKELLVEMEKFTGDHYVNARANSPAAETEEQRVQRMLAQFAEMDRLTLGDGSQQHGDEQVNRLAVEQRRQAGADVRLAS
jgi:hypothetical protein